MLKGRTALVTGSTSGIGLGIAKVLAEAGCAIALNSFEQNAESDALVRDLAAQYGVKVVFVKADVSKPAAVHAMVAEAEAKLGPLDILVNNAGIQFVAPVEDFPPEKWEQIIAINLSSAFHACHAAIAGMKARKWGRVINIASAHGLVASPFKSAYVAAKHGIVGFSKALALETAEFGVTVNAICPGYVWTPLVEKQLPDQMKAHNKSREDVIRDVILAPQPTKQFVTIEEVAALALYLCGDAAKSITGTALPIEGGWTAR